MLLHRQDLVGVYEVLYLSEFIAVGGGGGGGQEGFKPLLPQLKISYTCCHQVWGSRGF